LPTYNNFALKYSKHPTAILQSRQVKNSLFENWTKCPVIKWLKNKMANKIDFVYCSIVVKNDLKD
jgi:hypothetical protein